MFKTPTIIFLTFVAFGGFTTASIGRFLPYSGFRPIPRKTLGPINIKTNEVKNITTLPLALLINGNEKGLAKNTGYSAEVILDESFTSNAIIGGVLGPNLYVFRKMRFYWAGTVDGVAASTVNGENGTPLEVCIFYYNVKYGSFHNALNFRDGLIELIFRIQVGSTPNPLFTPFATILKKIEKAGSQVEFPIVSSHIFYYFFPSTSNYFIYPSAYVNESTATTYYCASSILAPLNPTHFISKQQFQDSFLSLLDYKGKPFVNQAKQYPRGRRPVVQSTGIYQVPNFIKIPSRIGSGH